MTLQLHSYLSAEDLPQEFECQIRSFLRIQWYDADEDDSTESLTASELNPVFFVLARDKTVISYARLIWANISHNGNNYRMYGLGDVFTFPASRNKGYGGQVVAAATDYIRADPQTNCAILLTEPVLHSFYQRYGWEHVPNLDMSFGEPDKPQPYKGYAMMLFLSKELQKSRTAFLKHQLFLPGDEW
jgi:predicted GNAT family N-acyltransferase